MELSPLPAPERPVGPLTPGWQAGGLVGLRPYDQGAGGAAAGAGGPSPGFCTELKPDDLADGITPKKGNLSFKNKREADD